MKLQKLVNLDRRWIFLLVALAVIIPQLLSPPLKGLKVSPPVQSVYKTMEDLPAGSPVLISFDFDPASKPELYPMAKALVRHALGKKHRLIATGLWITGTGLVAEILSDVGKETGAKDGEDYVYLGWSPGSANVIIGLGQDLFKQFPKDYSGKETRNLPVLQGVRNLGDIKYVISLAAGDPGVETWLVYGKEKHRFELAGGCTAVIAPGLYPLLNTGQLNGLIGGMKGAAEYESLLGRTDDASAGMVALSTGHFLIILLVVTSNVLYLFGRRKNGRIA